MYQHEKKVHFFPESFRVFAKSRSLELLGLFLLAISAFLLLSFLTYDPTDASLNVISSVEHFRNAFNETGAYIADFFIQYVGWSALLLPLCTALWGFLTLAHRQITSPLKRILSLGFAIICFNMASATFLTFFQSDALEGVLGIAVAVKLSAFFNALHFSPLLLLVAGVFFIMFCGSFFYAVALSFADWRLMSVKSFHLFKALFKAVVWMCQKWRSYTNLKPKTVSENPDYQPYETLMEDNEGGKDNAEDYLLLKEEADEEEIAVSRDFSQKPTAPLRSTQSPKLPPLSLNNEGSYTLPDLNLLKASDVTKQTPLKRSELEKNIEDLSQVLEDYGVKGKIIGAKPGPVVTLYELEPAPGIKSSRIIGLADDIARSMHALSARIAVVPGKHFIGIELPNDKRQMVYLQDLLTSKEFDNPQAKLNLALGKNISGVPILTDLAKMPHMIVAGTTGSGKSVGINAMILSLLYRHSPDTCRLILIDPKMLEFSMYNDIPHLLTPVVTEPNKAVFALKWAVREMENRYRGMSHLGVRNIENYNATLKQAVADGREITRTVQTGFDPETGRPIFEEQPINMKPLPYIVIVVDEMADLMMVAGKDIESAVQRLAQMARAAGIHVIMATQRPSVDVITGTIKANFPTRISFQVTSKFDSRTILGEQGAEQLLGKGDMLFMEAGGRIQRIHGPFVGDDEVERIVTFLKSQGSPDYVSNVCDESSDLGMETGGGSTSDEGDEMYMKAVAIVRSEQKASTSFIQRRLQIGYNRAARLIEQMEASGIVSSANHVGKREVLMEDGQ